MLREQDQLLDDHSAPCQQLRPLLAFDRHGHPPRKDVLQQPLLNGSMAGDHRLAAVQESPVAIMHVTVHLQ